MAEYLVCTEETRVQLTAGPLKLKKLNKKWKKMNLQNIARTFIVAPLQNFTRGMRNYFQKIEFSPQNKLTNYDPSTKEILYKLQQKLHARKSRLSHSQTSEELVPKSYSESQRE